MLARRPAGAQLLRRPLALTGRSPLPRRDQQPLRRPRDQPALVVHRGRGHPRDPGPSVVSASTHTQSPTGSRSRCTVISVFRNAHSAGSSAAETPDAESTQVISIAVPDSGSSGSSGTQRPHPDRRGARREDRAADPAPLDVVDVPVAPRRRQPAHATVGRGVGQRRRVPGAGASSWAAPRPAPPRTARPAATSCRVADSRETERPGRSTDAGHPEGADRHRTEQVHRDPGRGTGRASAGPPGPGSAGPTEARRAARTGSTDRPWQGSTAPRPGPRIGRRTSVQQPISSSPSGVCILLGRCPFSSVGRASPW